MNKRGKDNNKWQGRYCIVQNSSFGYKIKKDDAVFKGVLELADTQITMVVSRDRTQTHEAACGLLSTSFERFTVAIRASCL
jgi:hypothetical protein